MPGMSILMIIIGMIAGTFIGICLISLLTLAGHPRDHAPKIIEKGEQEKYSGENLGVRPEEAQFRHPDGRFTSSTIAKVAQPQN